MKKFFNKLYSSHGLQLLACIILALICFGVSYMTHGVYWETSDDPGIINIISGKYNGTPSFSFPFLNAFLGHFFVALYNITTLIPWYSIFHAIIKFAALVIIFRLIFIICAKKEVRWPIPLISCILIFAAVFLYPTLYMAFTTTAAISGCAAIALLFIAHSNSESKWRYVQYLLSGIFLILSFLIRYNCGQVVVCFYALILAYITIKAFQKEKRTGFKKLIKSAVAVVLIFVIGYAQNSASRTLKENYEPENYLTYNSYRSKFVDFTTASWETSQEFYEQLGWDEDFYHLAKTWFFIDARFNLENLKAINQETIAGGYGKWTVKEGVYSLVELVATDPVALSATLVVLALSAVVVIEFLLSENKRRDVLYLLVALCAVGGMGILCLYQCIQGRFLLRVYQTITFPTILVLLVVAFDLLDKKCFAKFRKTSVFTVALIAVLGLSAAGLTSYNVDQRTKESDVSISSKQVLTDYADEHPDTLFVYAPFLNTSYKAFSTYNPETAGPRNVMSWGGCGMYSKSYYEFLSLHDYETFYSDNLYDENVRLVIDVSETKREDIVKSYLEHNFGPTEMVEVYRTDAFIVYDINRVG